MVVVRFKVDEPPEAALVRLNQKLAANADRIPPGVIGPLVKPRSIDDVPILAVTVWSARYADDQLRSLASQLREAIAEVNDVSEVTIIGGRPRQVRVDIDPARLAAYDLDPLSVQQAITRANVRGTASGPVTGGGVTMPNVIAAKAGTACPQKVFVLGGHYDSVGATPGALPRRGPRRSRPPPGWRAARRRTARPGRRRRSRRR